MKFTAAIVIEGANMRVLFKKLNESAVLPFRSTDGASGYDVVAISDGVLYECGIDEDFYYYIEYSTGLSMEIPKGYEAQARCRSSISKTGLYLCNHMGTIDSDYRGEIKARFRVDHGSSISSEEQKKKLAIYKKGDKIFQLVFNKICYPEIDFTENLTDTARSDGGFGSTGK